MMQPVSVLSSFLGSRSRQRIPWLRKLKAQPVSFLRIIHGRKMRQHTG